MQFAIDQYYNTVRFRLENAVNQLVLISIKGMGGESNLRLQKFLSSKLKHAVNQVVIDFRCRVLSLFIMISKHK